MAAFSFMNRSRTDHQPMPLLKPMPILIFCCVRIFLPVHFLLSPTLLLCLSHFSLYHYFFTSSSSFIFSFCVICFGSLRFARFVFSAFLSTAQLIKKRFRLAFVFVFVPRAIAATHSRILFDSLCSSSHQLKIATMFGLSCPRVLYLFFFGSFRGAFEGFENLTNYLMIDGC